MGYLRSLKGLKVVEAAETGLIADGWLSLTMRDIVKVTN